MHGKVLDTQEINRLARLGWTSAQIAKHFNLPTMSVATSQHLSNWGDDPTLRERWEARMPKLKAQLKKLIEDTEPSPISPPHDVTSRRRKTSAASETSEA